MHAAAVPLWTNSAHRTSNGPVGRFVTGPRDESWSRDGEARTVGSPDSRRGHEPKVRFYLEDGGAYIATELGGPFAIYSETTGRCSFSPEVENEWL